jgi:NitT/TauT family transport system permease protein
MIFDIESIKHHLLRSSGVVVFMILWEIGPRLDWIDPYFVPPFSIVVAEIGKLYSDGSLITHLLVSSWRALLGLMTALAIGLPLGFTLGFRLVEIARALGPVLRVLSQVNPFSLMPVFMLFFGIGEIAKIAVIAWVSFWPILFYTITAVRNVDPLQVKTALSMGVSRVELFFKVIFPASLPVIFVGLRIGASITFFILVASEMLGANAGIGWLVHNSAMNYQIPRIYAGATFIVILGYLLNRSLLLLERDLFAWQEDSVISSSTAQPVQAERRPGKLSAMAIGVVLIMLLAFGGCEVRKVNSQNKIQMPTSDGHSHHFGDPVGE